MFDEPRPSRAGRRALLGAAAFVGMAAVAVLLLDRIGDLEGTLRRLEHASPALLGLAAGFEALSFVGYVALTRIVFEPAAPAISWAASAQITLAGVVATRVVTAGGAGGIALTAWALRGAGLSRRETATRLAAFLVVVYAVFFAALAVDGAVLLTDSLGEPAPQALALTATAIGALVIALGLATLLLPSDLEARRRPSAGAGRVASLARRALPAPAVARAAVALALRIARRQPVALVAAVAWWAFDVGVLWSTFEMFGSPPAAGVLVLCYLLGHAAQVIPIPGGVGPVEGGMIGAFAACGVSVTLAVVAVLAYQAISAWLPAAPGAWAYVGLRHSVARWRGHATEPSGSALRV